MKLLIATRNPGKLAEIKAQMQNPSLEIVSLNDREVDDSSFIEDGATFAENALKKARFYARATRLMTLADDSGIIVEALKDELGVKTRRWGLGEKVSDQAWVDYFLKRMEKEQNRKAHFVCHACVVDGNGTILFQTAGIVSGMVTKTLEAPIKPGLPLSSCFKPSDSNKVFAAMSTEEKARYSHRGKAIEKIKEYLANAELPIRFIKETG